MERRSIGERLRELREEKQLTARELARRSGVDASQILRIEKGQSSPRFQTVTALTEAMGIGTDQLDEGGKEEKVEAEAPRVELLGALVSAASTLSAPGLCAVVDFAEYQKMREASNGGMLFGENGGNAGSAGSLASKRRIWLGGYDRDPDQTEELLEKGLSVLVGLPYTQYH